MCSGSTSTGSTLCQAPSSIALEETAVTAGVAGNRRMRRLMAQLRHLEQQHVVVAVQAHLVHLLEMAGFLALVPQPLARAAPVHRLADARRALQRLAVHPGEHQHVVAAHLLRDHRQQALGIPLDIVEPAHRGSVAIRLRACPPQSPARPQTIAAPAIVPGSTGCTCHWKLLPGHRLALAHLELTLPVEDLAEVQAHAGMLVVDQFDLPRLGRADADAQFLVQFALQGLLDTFARLQLAARKLPIAGVDLA